MAGGNSSNTGGFPNYAGSYGGGTVAFNQLYDSTLVLADPALGIPYATGGWRAITPADFSEVIISGAQFSIGAVAVTGNPTFINNGGFVGITGTHAVTIAAAGVSGGYITLTGSNNTAFASVSTSTVSGSMSSITTGIGLQANATRKKLYAQVVGSGGPLYLNYGGVAASSTAFNVVLKNGSTDPATDGGLMSDSDFKGAVFVSGYIGAKWVLWEGV